MSLVVMLVERSDSAAASLCRHMFEERGRGLGRSGVVASIREALVRRVRRRHWTRLVHVDCWARALNVIIYLFILF